MDSKIYLCSDTHFGHDRGFIYEPRGFKSIQEHDEEIIRKWNSVVNPEDKVFHLGDVMLNDNDYGIECLKRLNGHITIVPGNHDTPTRINLYKQLPNVRVLETLENDIQPMSFMMKYRKYTFYLSHFPTMTSNLEKGPDPKIHILNLYGHTHQKTKFYQDIPYMFHVGLDSNDNTPVLLDDIIGMIKDKANECISML
jgi:calcineurin-like phosphoesterase family protein